MGYALCLNFAFRQSGEFMWFCVGVGKNDDNDFARFFVPTSKQNHLHSLHYL
jgi:hypothetical protein